MSDFKDDNVSDKLGLLKREAEEREAERRAVSSGSQYLGPQHISVELSALKLISESEARYASVAPIKLQDKQVALAVYDSTSLKAKEIMDKIKSLGYSVVLFVVSKPSLEKIFEHYKEIIDTPQEITSEINISPESYESQKEKITNLSQAEIFFKEAFSSKDASTSDIISNILSASMALKVSDIHLEAFKEDVSLRLRVDGLLHEVSKIAHETYRQILNRIKLVAGLKINIKDTPQDGRFTIKFDSEEIEVRVAISPSEFGEAIVMRVLNPKAISLSLADLGLRADDEEIALIEIKRPNGMVLVTGPTGSGKTTTLYAFLKTVNDPESKIITIEDPIEYHLSGIEQTQVDAKAGYTFASGLRSILRQDPDMLLVGEIRDLETAEIAVNASLTGHLVFSTLHTNNAAGAIPRMIDLGVKPSILGPALTLVVAQRLVRRFCEFCKKIKEPTEDQKVKIDEFLSKLPTRVKLYTEKPILYEAIGCDKCNHGYKGRLGIYELLELGPDYEELISKEPTETSIKKIAYEKGFVDMQKDGIIKVLGGLTSLEEVEKATGPIVW